MIKSVSFNLVCLLFFGLSTLLSSQKEDYHWCLGYNFERDTFIPGQGGIDIKFYDDSISVNYARRPIDFDNCNASISDINGDLLMYTNGLYIGNRNNEHMKNGDDLVRMRTKAEKVGQGCIFLPNPNDEEGSYLLIHNHTYYLESGNYTGFPILNVYFSKVEISNSMELGQVIEKSTTIFQDTLTWRFPAVRHANGRDWWIPTFSDIRNIGFMLLVQPKQIEVIDTFNFSFPWISGAVGQSVFSPQGDKFVQFASNHIYEGYKMDILDFDRCTGKFSNRQQITRIDTLFGLGGAISPSGQFAYFSAYLEVHQYDLWADKVEESMITVARFDSFFTIPGLTTLAFDAMGLGPDGKIYITGPGSTRHLGVIHAPDSAGLSCRLEQHAIELPAYTCGTMPNFPNYRLGPIDGSDCDTLGINNLPLARYRHLGKKLDKQFIDLSSYEPDIWEWTFGDGGTSLFRNPQYTYQKPGIYRVCLTVSNVYGIDSTCRDVNVDTLNTSVPYYKDQGFTLSPNPSDGLFLLEMPQRALGGILTIYNSLGQVILTTEIDELKFEYRFLGLISGVYTYVVTQEDEMMYMSKWVVQE